MSSKAVDVVLLPAEAMMDRAIEANAQLVERFSRTIVLNKENCFPHISLAMGCIDEGDISAIKEVLKTIAENSSLRKLRVVGIETSTNSGGEKVSVFAVEKTEQLQLLHEEVMQRLAPYLSHEVTEKIIAGEEASKSTLLWIRNYAEKSSYADFSPHITIGYGEIKTFSFPIEFNAAELALCHLGNHCTCRKVLISVKLKTS